MLPSVSNKIEPSLSLQQCKAPIHFTETEEMGNASGFVVSLKTSLERRPSTSHSLIQCDGILSAQSCLSPPPSMIDLNIASFSLVSMIGVAFWIFGATTKALHGSRSLYNQVQN